MTNKEWLDYLAHNAPDELAAWFDAEHVETEERALDGDTAAQDADSRDKLEADVRKHYAYSTTTLMYPPSANKTTDMLRALPVDTVIGWLDRQAAITEEQTRCKWVTASADEIAAWRSKAEKLQAKVTELTAERNELKESSEYYKLQYELASEDADRLTAERDKAREESVELYSDLVKASDEREHYREKCSKMATIIHDALMVMDEGMV